MITMSLRQTLESRGLDAGKGLYALHPFYLKVREAFPYTSLRNFISASAWPQTFTGTATNFDYPKDREPGWSNELNGVTHDSDYWYVTQKNTLWKFPVGWDLNDSIDGTTLPSIGVPVSNYDHFGDPNYYNGLLYIPLEGAQPPAVAVIESDTLQLVTSAALSAQTEAPWCAINPANGLLYSSKSYWFKPYEDEEPPNEMCQLEVYRPSFSQSSAGSQLSLTHLGSFALFDQNRQPIGVYRIQGGVFSKQGHLYLVSDVKGGGILGFDMISGRLAMHHDVDYIPVRTYKVEIENPIPEDAPIVGPVLGGGSVTLVEKKYLAEELEGITIWDLDDGQAPNISGQIHLLMIDNIGMIDNVDELLGGEGSDDLYFKHYKVVHPEDKNKI